jgi:hypothetical protein
MKIICYFLKTSLVGQCQWLTLVILATQETKIRRITVQSQLREIICETPSQKYPTQKRAGKVAQVVEHLPSKCEALSSDPSSTKKKKGKTFNVVFPVICQKGVVWFHML